MVVFDSIRTESRAFSINWEGRAVGLLMRPVAQRYYMSDLELETERRLAHEAAKA
ncbi:MAG: hypothetical protein ACREXU_17690 [Gammaproteobacteria bacterium]